MKPVAVVGCTLVITWDDPTVTGGVVTISTPPSAKVRSVQKPVYRGTLSCSVLDVVGAPDYTQSADVTFTLEPTSQKTSADGMFVIREDDTAPVSVALTSPSSSAKTVTGTAKVVSAGQQKVNSK